MSRISGESSYEDGATYLAADYKDGATYMAINSYEDCATYMATNSYENSASYLPANLIEYKEFKKNSIPNEHKEDTKWNV